MRFHIKATAIDPKQFHRIWYSQGTIYRWAINFNERKTLGQFRALIMLATLKACEGPYHVYTYSLENE